MKTSSSNSWWREMGAISRGMMFIEGSIATPMTLDPAEQEVRAAEISHRSPLHQSRPTKQGKKAFSLYEDLLFLGGRPMTAGHNDDIDEPFPQTGADADEAQASVDRPGNSRRGYAAQPQHCATC